MMPSSSKDLGPECFEFRLLFGRSEFVMASYALGAWFIFTSGATILSPQLSSGTLDVLCKVR